MADAPAGAGRRGCCGRLWAGIVYYTLAVLETLILCRRSVRSGGQPYVPADPSTPPPFAKASVFSRIYFTWASALISAAAFESKKPGVAELWHLRQQEQAVGAEAQLQREWQAELRRAEAAAAADGGSTPARGCCGRRQPAQPASFRAAVWRTVRWAVFRTFVAKMGWLLFAVISNAVLLREVLAFFKPTSTQPASWGFFLAGMYLLSELLRSVCVNQHWLSAVLMGTRLRAAARALVFNKAVRLRDTRGTTTGKAVNMMTADAARLMEACNYGIFLLSCPITIIVTLALMWLQLGPSALAGFAVMLLAVPLQARLGAAVGELRKTTVKITDERARVMNEVLTGIKLVKLNAWEAAFADRVAGIRSREMRQLRRGALLRTVNNVVAASIPALVPLAAFTVYVLWAEESLTASAAYVVIALFNVARFPLGLIPLSVKFFSEAGVACGRIQEFLQQPEAREEDCPIALPQAEAQQQAQAAAAPAAREASAPAAAVADPPSGEAASQEAMAGLPPVGSAVDMAAAASLAAADARAVQQLQQRQELELVEVRIIDAAVDAKEQDARRILRDRTGDATAELPPADVVLEFRNAAFRWPTTSGSGGGGGGGSPSGQGAVSGSSGGKRKCCRRAAAGAAPKASAAAAPPAAGGAPASSASASPAASPASPSSGNSNNFTGLADLSFTVRKGECIGIVGAVAQGKSSLLAAVLGQLLRAEGAVLLRGRVAYAPQLPWLFNGSVRENILFGQPYDAARYDEVVVACALLPDLAALPSGDATEIGERGLNLSGGQKARVQLARALYSDRDVYLLDDPLSAVDVHVGRHLWEQAICRMLLGKGKTVLIATHQLQFLAAGGGCDRIAVMERGKLAGPLCPPNQVHAYGYDLSGHAAATIAAAAAGAGAGGAAVAAAAAASPAAASTAASPAPTTTAAAIAKPSSDAKDSAPAAPVAPAAAAPAAPAAAVPASPDKPAAAAAAAAAASPRSGKLIAAEDRASGSVSMGTILSYARAAGSAWLVPLLLAILACSKGSMIVSAWFISYWTQHVTVASPRQEQRDYLGYYAVTVAGVMFFALVQGVVFSLVTTRSARVFHNSVFVSVIRATAAWFDQQPTGRILSRFTGDVDVVDNQLSAAVEQAAEYQIQVLASLVLIAVIFPWFLVAMIPLVGIFLFIAQVFRSAARELKRLDNISRSPLVSHVQGAMSGLASIRAYDATGAYVRENIRLVDNQTRTYMAFYASNRWIAIRLDFVTMAVAVITVILCVIARDGLAPGIAGLVITQALQTAGIFQYATRLISECEAHFTSVERLSHYSSEEVVPHDATTIGPQLTDAEAEAALARYPPRKALLTNSASGAAAAEAEGSSTGSSDGALARARSRSGSTSSAGSANALLSIPVSKEASKLYGPWSPSTWSQPLLAAAWPAQGELVFDNVCARYRDGLPLVLDGVSFKIQPGMRVGVVGRTGAGKTTLTLTLFRLMELASGAIRLDGIDIRQVPVYQLRSRLSVIPQDPTLFSGTVRSNLDMFGQYVDSELWAALEAAGLAEQVRSHPAGLEREVNEGGANLSAGSRQMLCLARAVLRRSPVAVLDEATSQTDTAADAAIGAAIGASRMTTVVVAHRLHTVAACDRVLVMAPGGRVMEYDSPAALLGLVPRQEAIPASAGGITGIFSSMVDETGPETAAVLRTLAMQGWEQRGCQFQAAPGTEGAVTAGAAAPPGKRSALLPSVS